uniref:Methyltransferase FkbM domain-containing protein n=1 Tax=Lotharella oceanica TaxID=641309 RepID=A0A7S2TW60_9EUKA|mmetsp:Transcript_32646/g.60702  ORF Transcript_32646/g.60702 Transcript_32646/m.60702 type:complete len:178 (+) Transcript_32646:585-1118(+)
MLFKHGRRDQTRVPVYVDLAAFHPKKISNTYFFDVCLGWEGLCIEGDPAKIPLFNSTVRGCHLVPKLISARDGEEVVFASQGGAGGSGITGKLQPAKETYFGYREIKLKTTTLEKVLDSTNVKHVDLLSLDVEGAEMAVLDGTRSPSTSSSQRMPLNLVRGRRARAHTRRCSSSEDT